MRTLLKSWIVRAAALLFVASTALAQDRVPFRQEELDQMLAPVALYPDSLLSQMLMAATYPLEVVQAARWSRANPGLKGQNAVNAAEPMDWDPSVKSLAAFPQVLSMMNEKLEWTERLGEAFLAQQEDVMSTVQGLRRRAEAAGNLRSSDQMRVVRQEEAIVIEPPMPQVVYVPYYNPTVVYGPWWWPAYPPVYWAPPPAYYAVPAYRPAFIWGSGIVISAGFFFGHFDWPHRHVKVMHAHHHRAHPTHVHSAWRHDPAHRRGVPFRNAGARQQFEQARAADARRDAGRNDAARTGRRAGDSRSADIRQRRLEGRRELTRDRRDDRRESAGNRLAPTPVGNRVDRTVNRSSERRQTQRPQARGSEPQRVTVAPVARPERRPAVSAPAVRAEPRLPAPRADTRPAPRQLSERSSRREARNNGDARAARQPSKSVPAPRAAGNPARQAAAPTRAPRMESPQQRGARGAPSRGKGNQRGERSANRGNARGS